ncbi:MAG: hypothetical protein HRU23_19045 [Gammaproteobacteria bacterium]|nr:hypothetical protein [Gammaproteobacteria bacterium]
MVALAKDRRTPRRSGVDFNDPVAAAVKIYAGALVVLNAAGDAAPGTTALGLKVRGVSQENVDNTAGGKKVNSMAGIFRLGNDGSITRADIGNTAYIVDDQTVADTDGTNTRSAAGTIVDVDSVGVWVQVG